MDPVLCTVKFIWPQHHASMGQNVWSNARPERGKQKCSNAVPLPVPPTHPPLPSPIPPLRLNIDTCITSLNIVCEVSVQDDSIEARYKQLKFCF